MPGSQAAESGCEKRTGSDRERAGGKKSILCVGLKLRQPTGLWLVLVHWCQTISGTDPLMPLRTARLQYDGSPLEFQPHDRDIIAPQLLPLVSDERLVDAFAFSTSSRYLTSLSRIASSMRMRSVISSLTATTWVIACFLSKIGAMDTLSQNSSPLFFWLMNWPRQMLPARMVCQGLRIRSPASCPT